MRVFVAGATGYIGRFAVRALVARGHEVVAFARPRAADAEARTRADLPGAELRFGEVTDPASLAADGFAGERFDAIVSCLASRSGAPDDAWRVDHGAHVALLEAGQAAGIQHFVLLSAICVQRPKLAFQHAKLAFERALMEAGVTYSIVRPTAFFKSLAGQVARVQAGRPFLMFGDGEATACKPISERDLGAFLADCLEDDAKRNAILPVGGPGPAISPNAQAAMLAEACGVPLKVKRVPFLLMDVIVGTLTALGLVWPKMRARADLARIGRYYASESMLLWDEAAGAYDADATPEYGTDTLAAFYRRVAVEGLEGQTLGEHSVFKA